MQRVIVNTSYHEDRDQDLNTKVLALGSGFKGFGFGVLGFWVQGSRFKVLGSGFWVLGSGFWVLGFKVQGF